MFFLFAANAQSQPTARGHAVARGSWRISIMLPHLAIPHLPQEGPCAAVLRALRQHLEAAGQPWAVVPCEASCHASVHLTVTRLSGACFNLNSRLKYFSSCLAFLVYDCPNAATFCWCYHADPEEKAHVKFVLGTRWSLQVDSMPGTAPNQSGPFCPQSLGSRGCLCWSSGWGLCLGRRITLLLEPPSFRTSCMVQHTWERHGWTELSSGMLAASTQQQELQTSAQPMPACKTYTQTSMPQLPCLHAAAWKSSLNGNALEMPSSCISCASLCPTDQNKTTCTLTITGHYVLSQKKQSCSRTEVSRNKWLFLGIPRAVSEAVRAARSQPG